VAKQPVCLERRAPVIDPKRSKLSLTWRMQHSLSLPLREEFRASRSARTLASAVNRPHRDSKSALHETRGRVSVVHSLSWVI
jgi:hypothetical protein